MLKIQNLHAEIDGKEILKGLNLEVKAGEVHAIMGPNGAGKSTLASVLAGKEDYEITKGSVEFEGKDLLDLETDERAKEGLFLAFQYPVEIPGVSNINFLRTAINEKREYLGQEPISAKDFIDNIELFSYNRNTLKENRERKTLPPTTYIKNSGFGAKTKLKV